jgi:hypothetical protein
VRIYGVDFTSSPRKAKPIAAAAGVFQGKTLRIGKIERLETFEQFEAFLSRPGPWIGGFDFPFGLSREAVEDLAWPTGWSDLLLHCRRLGRVEFKRLLDAYRLTRPKGRRYAKRLGDTASGAHPSVKFVNPPVAFMFLEGASRLAAAGLHIPGLQAAERSRIALEAYPGMLVRKQLGIAHSYKNDAPAKQTPARRAVRKRILAALEAGKPLGVRLRLAPRVRSAMLEDGSGDALDSVICAIQACWGWQRRKANFGLPAGVDPLEGWIVSA